MTGARADLRPADGISRRALLARGGLLAAALGALPALLAERGIVAEALAADDPLTRETFDALVAFVLPGDDAYSQHQGEHHPGPGGVAGGAGPALAATFDAVQPGIPASAAIAELLNAVALEVAPAAAGPFAAPFARLSFADKGRVFQRLEEHARLGATGVEYGIHLLPSAAAQHAYGEAGVFDREARTITRRPVGWDVTGYEGPRDGSRELPRPWRGRRSARTQRRYAVRRRRRRAPARGRARR